MSEPKSMRQPRLLGEATEEVIFPLSCRLLYYDFNRGSENPRQPVYDSSGGSNWRVHPVPPPYCLITTCVQDSIPIDPAWVLRFSPIHF